MVQGIALNGTRQRIEFVVLLVAAAAAPSAYASMVPRTPLSPVELALSFTRYGPEQVMNLNIL